MPGLDGASESASLCSALILAMSVFRPWFLHRSARVYCNEGLTEAATSENAVWAKFAALPATEVGVPRRGTMRLALGQREAKERGFLEEALARPGG